MDDEFRARLLRRAQVAAVSPLPHQLDQLERYFRMLSKWNRTINLTALPLDDPTDETLDRLLIEPLSAAAHVDNEPVRWFDLGSGGGSLST